MSILLTFSFAYAEMDFSSMSDDELHALISGAESELSKRSAEESSDLVLYDENGIKLYMTGEYVFKKTTTGNTEYLLYYDCIAENNSNGPVEFLGLDSSVNGWDTGDVNFFGKSTADLTPSSGKKAMGKFCISMAGTDVTKYKDIKTLEFTLGLYFHGQAIYVNPPETSKLIRFEFNDGEVSLVK